MESLYPQLKICVIKTAEDFFNNLKMFDPMEKRRLKNIHCDLCGSKEYKVLHKSDFKNEKDLENLQFGYKFSPLSKKTPQIVKCLNCGLVFVNPRPVGFETLHTEVVKDEVYIKTEKETRITARRNLKNIEKRIKCGKILDIGCSTGIFLDEAKKKNWKCQGIELASWAVEKGKNLGLDIKNKPLRKIGFSNNLFDVVTLWGVIEHFSSPRNELIEIYRILKPGGLLCIYTGDVDSFWAKILRKNWWWYLGMHLYYFSRDSLKSMLEKLGFNFITVERYTRTFQFFSLADSLKRYRYLSFLIGLILKAPRIKDVSVDFKLAGELMVYASKGA